MAIKAAGLIQDNVNSVLYERYLCAEYSVTSGHFPIISRNYACPKP